MARHDEKRSCRLQNARRPQGMVGEMGGGSQRKNRQGDVINDYPLRLHLRADVRFNDRAVFFRKRNLISHYVPECNYSPPLMASVGWRLSA